jgi:hypothetical protein
MLAQKLKSWAKPGAPSGETYASLTAGRVYVLDPNKKFPAPKPQRPERPLSLAEEYGLR